MIEVGVAENLKRAARFNPAWTPARIFKVATDENGEALSDASGTFIYDQTEETFGRLSFEQEGRVWVEETPWLGHAIICLITANPPRPYLHDRNGERVLSGGSSRLWGRHGGNSEVSGHCHPL